MLTAIPEEEMSQRSPLAREVTRVRIGIAPLELESPRGYLCRVAGCFSYASPLWLTELANFTRADDLELAEKVDELAFALRLEPDLWRSMLYLKVKDGKRFWRRQFFGQLISADRLNYGAPRICPACLRETAIWWGIWDLAITSACPGHRCQLVSKCPHCGEALTWRRPGVELCRCGFDLRETETMEAESDLVAINAAIHKRAGFPVGIGSFDLGNAGFPPDLEGLALDDLIGLILAISALQGDPLQPQKPAMTELCTAERVVLGAAHVLGQWSFAFQERLSALLPRSGNGNGGLTFRGVYGDFYQYLLDAAHHDELEFLISAFGEFAGRHWPGMIRGQHRMLSQSTHGTTRWIAAPEAARVAGLTAPQIANLVRKEELTGIIVSPPKSRRRVECWLDRDGLTQWIASRDADLAAYIRPKEARRLLGLTKATFRTLACSGLIGTCRGPDRGFPPGVHIRRQDVERIVAAFRAERPAIAPNRDEAILLREAMRHYLGRAGFSEFVRSVLSGAVQPAARDSSVAGILGSRFCISDVKQHAPTKPKVSTPSGLVTYAVAGAQLGVTEEVVRNLVAEGLLRRNRKPSHGIQLVCARDVDDFASKYATVKSIAERLEVGSRTVSQTLKKKGVEILVIPLPGKGNKLFARKGPKSDLAVLDLGRQTQQELA